jgi:hypothetical protein
MAQCFDYAIIRIVHRANLLIWQLSRVLGGVLRRVKSDCVIVEGAEQELVEKGRDGLGRKTFGYSGIAELSGAGGYAAISHEECWKKCEKKIVPSERGKMLEKKKRLGLCPEYGGWGWIKTGESVTKIRCRLNGIEYIKEKVKDIGVFSKKWIELDVEEEKWRESDWLDSVCDKLIKAESAFITGCAGTGKSSLFPIMRHD